SLRLADAFSVDLKEFSAVAHEPGADYLHIQPFAPDVHPGTVTGVAGYPGQRDGTAQGRGKAAAGDDALAVVDHDLLAAAQHCTLLQYQTDLPGQIAGLALALQRPAADEVPRLGFPGDGPGHVGGQGRGLFVDIGAVEIQSGLQSQGIPGAQSAGLAAGALQGVPEGCRLRGRQQDFQTVLAGIAGTGYEPVTLGLPMDGVDPLGQRGLRICHHTGATGPGQRALDRDHRQLPALGPLDLPPGSLAADPFQITLAGTGIDHQPVAVGQAVDDEVVEDTPVRVEHGGIQRPARRLQTTDVVGQQVLQEGGGVSAGDIHHAHVRNVEDPGLAAHLMVLLDLRTVMQWHVPAAEIDHPGTGGQVTVIQGCAQPHGVVPCYLRPSG